MRGVLNVGAWYDRECIEFMWEALLKLDKGGLLYHDTIR